MQTGASTMQSCLCPIVQCKIIFFYLEVEIEMDEDPPASCGYPGSDNGKVCVYEYNSFFLPSDLNL